MESIITLIIAGITLIVAGMTLYVNYVSKQIANDLATHEKERYEQEVDAKAREFISKYNMKQTEFDIPKISKIYLCVIAYMFNPIYSYKDNMYTDFNNLSTDVKNKVLELRKLSLKIDNTNNSIYEVFHTGLIDMTKQNYPQLLNLVENDSDNTLADTYLQNGCIAQDVLAEDGNILNRNIQQNKDILLKCCIAIAKSFENNSFNELIDDFYSEDYSQNYYRYKLCIIAQQICVYSAIKANNIDKDKFIQIMNNYITSQELDYFNPNFTYEDLFLFTIFVWYICDNVISKNIRKEIYYDTSRRL